MDVSDDFYYEVGTAMTNILVHRAEKQSVTYRPRVVDLDAESVEKCVRA
jgi:hypothetical protein